MLTGDVGSGKSSLVDAITSLLVPHQKITYNKAAGAEKQERSLYTYIRGAYGNEQDEQTQTSKLLTLRDETSYSVILGVFHNEAIQRSMTLAQVFRLKKNDKNPERFYVLAEGALSIKADFFGNIKNISDIRTSLKKNHPCETFDSFKEYGQRFRQEFGIKSEQALDLFYQAVSMKSVGNLTDFVRSHMLEKTEAFGQIEELCASFEDLRGAHDAILKARKQIEMLQPIKDSGERFDLDQLHKEDLLQQRNFIDPYFENHRADLLKNSLQKLEDKKEKVVLQIEKRQLALQDERGNRLQLEMSLQSQGGGRVQALKTEIEQKTKEKERRVQHEARYREPCDMLGHRLPKTVDEFLQNRNDTQILRDETKLKKEKAEADFVDLKIELSKLQTQETDFRSEIDSLKKRQTNIPLVSLRLRAEMALALGLAEDDLPFAGELLQVKTSEKKWQGAVERVLRNFGLSLLVSEAHYAQVSRYVNKTHLRGKVVYFRVQPEKRSRGRLSPDSLVAKIDIRRDSDFFDWIRNELDAHFNFECCENIEDFQRYPKALSLTGQMKMSGKKHEKDDRHALDDRTRYVLGWSNKEKIEALKKDLEALQKIGQGIADRVFQCESFKKEYENRLRSCESLLHFQSYEEINWQNLAVLIHDLEKEIKKLTEESNVLKVIEGLLEESKVKINEHEERVASLQREQGQLETDITTQTTQLQQALEVLNSADPGKKSEIFQCLKLLSDELGVLNELNLANLNKRQSLFREGLQARIDALASSLGRQSTKISQLINHFLSQFPEFKVNVDASVESVPELKMLMSKLQDEDLPRHEARFYKKLKEDTINGMAMFQELLEKERRGIENKIQVINDCLRGIDYNPGTYICILLNKNIDQEIVHFRQDLRMILSNTTGSESVYTEQKFLQVKEVIDRLKGRPQQIDADKKWTQKVTDVRNWFVFAASERFKADNIEKEFYPDSGGKSGGQKEKLAYTVLASALAYQYGIEALYDTPKSFRFVMIDEAFGRGSDESARYGLTLFEKLNLQLLVVTPLQKIHVIEDYVSHVHFIHNEASKDSRIHSLTIEQFRERKTQHLLPLPITGSEKIREVQ